MIHVMVRSAAVGNILKCEPPHEAHDAGITRLKDSVGLHVHFVKLVHETIDHHLRGINHREILVLKISRALRWCARRAATGRQNRMTLVKSRRLIAAPRQRSSTLPTLRYPRKCS